MPGTPLPVDPLELLQLTTGAAEILAAAYGASFTDGLDYSVLQLEGPLSGFVDLELFVDAGHRVDLTITPPSARIAVSWDEGAPVEVVCSGNLEDAFPSALPAVAAACRDRDGWRLVSLCSGQSCRLRITLKNRPEGSGFHWVRTLKGIAGHLDAFGWVGFVARLGVLGRPKRLIISDARDHYVLAAGLCCHGPLLEVDNVFRQGRMLTGGGTLDYPPELRPLREQAELYAKTWLTGERSCLPPPVAFRFLERHGDDLAPLEQQVRRIFQALSWVWLADSAVIEGKGVAIRFNGSQEFDLSSAHEEPVAGIDGRQVRFAIEAEEDAFALWRMGIASTDHLRHESVQRAFNMTVRTESDLGTAAKRVRSMAEYLFDLSQRNLIAEALRVRSEVQREAVEAAKNAADASRLATRAVVDRVFTQLVAALGLLFASLADLIGSSVAAWLLLVILLLTLLTGGVALRFDLPGAQSILRGFKGDLQRFRDVLRDEDLDDIGGMARVREAEAEVRRATKTVYRIVLPTALLLTAMAAALLASR